jgi:molecular chaperone DnaK
LELLERVRLGAEAAKRALSGAEITEIRLPLRGGEWSCTLTRAELEEIITPVVERTLEPCRQALADAGITAAEIDEVVLVGGATRVPLVRRRVAELFAKQPQWELNPDEVVALGAGVQAGILSGQVEGLLLLDVNPLSLGIETYGGAVEKLIPRNSTIPTSARQMFSTGVDGQTAILIHVVQGERELAKDCRSLARFTISIPPMPANWPRLEVTFLVDENGILSVSAYEHRSNAEARIDVRPSYGLTDDEVERMVIESFEHAEEDLRQRQLVEARGDADQDIQAIAKLLPDAEGFDRAGQLPAADLERIRAALAALKEARDGDDFRLIRTRDEALQHAARNLTALIMDQAARHALQGQTLEEAGGAISGAVRLHVEE